MFEKYALKISYVIAACCTILATCLSTEIYDDIANWYAPMTRAFINGNYDEAFNANVPTLNVNIAGIIGKILPLSPFSCLILTGCFFFIFTIPLVYYITNFVLKDKNKASLAALLYTIAPQIIRFSVNGLLNSSKNFFLCAIIALLISIYRKNSFFKNILLGLLFAFTAMSRAECIAFIPFFGIAYLIILIRKIVKNDLKKDNVNVKKAVFVSISSIFLLFFSFTLTSTPKLHEVYKQTNIPSFDYRQSRIIGKILNIKTTTPKHNFVERAGFDDISKSQTKFIKSFKIINIIKAVTKGSYTLYFILALIGLLMLIIKKKFNQRYLWLILFCIINFSIIIFFTNSSRYYSINTILLMPLTINGIYFILELLKSKPIIINFWNKKHPLRYMLYVGLISIAIIQIIHGMKKTFSTRDKGQYLAGKWLAKEYKNNPSLKNKKLLTTSAQIGYYADVDIFYSIAYTNDQILNKNLDKLKNFYFIAIRNRKNDKLISFLKKQPFLEIVKCNFDNKVTLFRNKFLNYK